MQAVFAVILCTSGAPWTIHGLWPQNEWCDKTPLNMTALAPLVPTLQQDWPNCFAAFQDDESFWTHEWQKHGSCTGMGQVGFFNYTLALYERLLPSLPAACKFEEAKKECKLQVTIKNGAVWVHNL